MTTHINAASDQKLSPKNPTPNTSDIYKTIMAIRAAHAPIEDEEDHGIETDRAGVESYARANNFAKPAAP